MCVCILQWCELQLEFLKCHLVSLWHVGHTEGCELNPEGNDEFLKTVCVCSCIHTHSLFPTIIGKSGRRNQQQKCHMVLSPRTIRMNVCCISLCSYSCLYQEYVLFTIWYAALFGQLPYTYSKCYLKIKILSN